MTDGPVSGVGLTALAVAHCRAVDSAGENALVNDPFARDLVERAGVPVGAMDLSNDTTRRLYESVATRTRFIDDTLVESTDPQIVCLGAGLDTRPWRLPLDGRVWFDVDRTDVVTFKSESLGSTPASAKVSYVAADLTKDWMVPLRSTGFSPALPTTWILEGVTMYLSEEENRSVLREIAEHSPSGSSLITVGFGPGYLQESQSQELARRVDREGAGFKSIIESPSDWLGPDWSIETAESFKERAASYGRDIPYSEEPGKPVSWLIAARRA